MTATLLEQRAVVRLPPLDSDEDVRGFLQGLVTNDVSGELPVYAALLSAQGKAMYDFLVWSGGDEALLLDCEEAVADDLVKRLSLYRLRRKIVIARDDTLSAHWSLDQPGAHAAIHGMPISAIAGSKRSSPTIARLTRNIARIAYRSACPEGRAELGDILWLETNAVELNGVSFEKGCYIGQENTARMNWRQKVNRRLVVMPLEKSDEKRRKAAYPDLGLAVYHLRVSDIDPETLPDWQRSRNLGLDHVL